MYVVFHNKNYTIIIIIHTTILTLCGLNKKRFACSYKYGMYDLVENELTILNQNLNLDPAPSLSFIKKENSFSILPASPSYFSFPPSNLPFPPSLPPSSPSFCLLELKVSECEIWLKTFTIMKMILYKSNFLSTAIEPSEILFRRGRWMRAKV